MDRHGMFVSAARRLAQWTILLTFCGCFQQPPRFVDGPESADLAQKATGYLVVKQGWDSAEPDHARIMALSLPDLDQIVVRRGWVQTISGPDEQGRVAFVERSQGGYVLKTIHLDGQAEEVLFERPRDAQSDPARKNIALSPRGGLLAFIGNTTRDQNPGALLTLGPLEIWDIRKKAGSNTNIIAFDDKLWWSSNGKELAYVALLDRDQIPNRETLPGSPYGRDHEEKHGTWNKYPVVFILNVETGKKRLLHPGAKPIFSHNWEKALIFSGGKWLIVNTKTLESRPFNFPASWEAKPEFLLTNDLVIFQGLPTRGNKPRWLKRGSFSVGTQMGSIKIGDVDKAKFETVVHYVDFRDELSFGIVKKTKLRKG